MNDRYLRDIVLNFLIAGKDTTANTLTWFFYMLCKNPIVQDKVALEIKESVEWDKEDNNNTEHFTEKLNESAIDKMHYLHAAISETLRLYPAVPVDSKMADEDDVLPNGYRVIKGDGMNYMTYAMGRMTYLWGEDAEDFRPERWLVNGIFQQESLQVCILQCWTPYLLGEGVCIQANEDHGCHPDTLLQVQTGR